MSGLEILGVAASAMQVAQVSLAIFTSLTSLFNQLRDAPKILQARLLHVQTLIDVSVLISKKPLLQTVEVGTILQVCMRDGQALKDMLQALVAERHGSKIKKWTNAIGSLIVERRIAGLLQSLEGGKTSLTLCIVQIDSSLLCAIDKKLETIHGAVEEVSQNVRTGLPLIRSAIDSITARELYATLQELSDACLASLAAKDQRPFLTQMLKRSRKTCNWMLSNPKYISWRESADSCLLRITANPGHGKTTLAARVTQQLTTEERNFDSCSGELQTRPIVLYYFFRRSNQDVAGAAAVALRTILTQLVEKFPNSLPTILRRHHSLLGSFEWSWDSLQACIDDVLHQISPGATIHIILDALDECEDYSRQLILDWIQELFDREDEGILPDAVRRPTLKVLVTSRPDENAADCLSRFPWIEIGKSDTANDLRALIRIWMKDFSSKRHLNTEVAKRISSFLEDNADGMFLWVVLIMEELSLRDERLSDDVISVKLSSIPLTLLNTYEAIIRNASTSRREDMWRILRWLLYGRRGLALAEMETALCLETGTSSWYNFTGDLKHLCGSLIRFDGPQSEVNLIHQTTRDFLRRFVENAGLRETGDIQLTFLEAHKELAKVCVGCLLHNEIFQKLDDPDYRNLVLYRCNISDFLKQHSFLCYAIEGWAFHLQALGTISLSLSSMVNQLLSSRIHRDGIMILDYFLFSRGNPLAPTGMSATHLAAYFNFPWLIDMHVQGNPDVVHDCICSPGVTPLICAAEMGSLASVKVLLDAGADPNTAEWDGWTPLHWAARNGHLEVCRVLLDHGARVEKMASKDLTALDWAVGFGCWDVVTLLGNAANDNQKAKLEKLMKEKQSTKGSGTSLSTANWKEMPSDDWRTAYGARAEA